MFQYEDIHDMSQGELVAAWRYLGERLANKGDEWLRQALECAFVATVDQEEACDDGQQQLLERFMVDVQALIDNGGSKLLRAVVEGFQFSNSVNIADLSLHELCRRMFSIVIVTDALGGHYLGAMYGDSAVDADEHAPALSIQYEDFNPNLSSGLGALHEAASEMLARGPTLDGATKLWAARVKVGHVYRPLAFEGIGVIYWAARRLIRTPQKIDEYNNARFLSAAASSAKPSIVGHRIPSGSPQHDVFMDSVTAQMAALLGVPEHTGDRVARRVRFEVPGKQRKLRLRVRVVTQGERRIEVCLVSTTVLPRENEPYPSGLVLETWERSSQIFTGFRIRFHALDYIEAYPVVLSALQYLIRCSAQLS